MATKQPLPTTPVHDVKAPVIEYVGDVEKAKEVIFTINPLAQKYVVRDNGMVLEYL